MLRAVEQAHGDLRRRGYSILTDTVLGLDCAARGLIARRYFHNGVLEVESYADTYPPDRLRARDALRYEWSGREATLTLSEHDDISIVTPAGLLGTHPHLQRGIYRRVRVLQDASFAAIARAMLELVPTERRQGRGTFAINLFRAHADVVTGLHQDGEEPNHPPSADITRRGRPRLRRRHSSVDAAARYHWVCTDSHGEVLIRGCQQGYPVDAIVALFTQNGLVPAAAPISPTSDTGVYGDYDLRPLDDHSRRIIIRAVKESS